MDFIVEFIALGIDSIILISCIRQYYNKKNAVCMISSAPALPIDKTLKDIIKTQPDAKLPYITIRGTVKSYGVPIISTNNPRVSGVIQSLKIKEHVVQRSSTGFWADSERTIQEVHNVVPFGLDSKGISVEVIDPLVAQYLDMDVISDTFHPTNPSVMDHIWGFFAGFRQRGIQSTEKMLREGTMLTGIGELVCEKDGNLKIQPPANGGQYYITSLSVTSLVKKLETSKRNYGVLAFIFGTTGAVIVGLILRKYWKLQKEVKLAEERKVKLEETRKTRRKQTRDTSDLQDNQVCVVCRTNPIEIILLPCGHVCLCEDCADDITNQCPICRAFIEVKRAAYVI